MIITCFVAKTVEDEVTRLRFEAKDMLKGGFVDKRVLAEIAENVVHVAYLGEGPALELEETGGDVLFEVDIQDDADLVRERMVLVALVLRLLAL